MPREADLVSEFSTSTGTGSMVVSGAVPGYQTWQSGFGDSNLIVHYGIRQDGTPNFETGIGTWLPGSTAIQRDLVLASSSGGSKVAFSAGDKIVYCMTPAESPKRVLVRRSSDIGVEIIPAAGQSASMIRVQAAGGGDAFAVDAAGKIATEGGLALGSATASGVTDLSRHVALWGTTYGFNVYNAAINYNAPSSAAHEFRIGGTLAARISATGVDASLRHSQSGGYFRIGAFSTGTYGTGDARIYYDATNRRLSIASDNAGSVASIALGLDGLWLNATPDGTRSPGRVSAATGAALFLRGGVATGTIISLRDVNDDIIGVVQPGTSAGASSVIMDRGKSDARYQLAVSSEELKEDIEHLAPTDTTGIMPRTWIWRMDGHPRNGLRGAGFIYEEVAAAFPEATYPAGDGRPGGLDTNALLAAFVGSTREALAVLSARIDALETA